MIAAHGEHIHSHSGVLVLSKGLVPPLGTAPSAFVSERCAARAVAALGGPAHAAEMVDRGASVIVVAGVSAVVVGGTAERSPAPLAGVLVASGAGAGADSSVAAAGGDAVVSTVASDVGMVVVSVGGALNTSSLAAAGGEVVEKAGERAETVRALQLRVISGVLEGVVGVAARMAAGARRRLPSAVADVELHLGGKGRSIAPGVGLEPTTLRLTAECSSN